MHVWRLEILRYAQNDNNRVQMTNKPKAAGIPNPAAFPAPLCLSSRVGQAEPANFLSAIFYPLTYVRGLDCWVWRMLFLPGYGSLRRDERRRRIQYFDSVDAGKVYGPLPAQG